MVWGERSPGTIRFSVEFGEAFFQAIDLDECFAADRLALRGTVDSQLADHLHEFVDFSVHGRPADVQVVLHADAGKEGQDHLGEHSRFHGGFLGFDISRDQMFDQCQALPSWGAAALRPYELRRQNAERSPTLFNVAWACCGEKGRHLGERRSPYQALARRRPCWSEKTAPRRSFQMRHQRATCSSDRKSSMVFQVKTMFSYQRDAGTAK